MKRALIVLAVPAAALAIIIPLTNAGAQAPTGRTINLVERDKGSTFGFVDNAPRNKSRPSASPWSRPVTSTRSRTPCSTAPTRRVWAASRPHASPPTKGRISKAPVVCQGAAALNDGTLTFQAYIKGEEKVATGAITGGTGAYANARGT